MKSLSQELKLFVLDFQSKLAVLPEPETVNTLKRKLYRQANHEMWRTCNNCGDQFDLKKELSTTTCPKCGSEDLRPGN